MSRPPQIPQVEVETGGRKRDNPQVEDSIEHERVSLGVGEVDFAGESVHNAQIELYLDLVAVIIVEHHHVLEHLLQPPTGHGQVVHHYFVVMRP